MADEENEWPTDGLKDLIKEPQIDPDEQLKQKYRHVFINNPMGREVLEDILVNLCHLPEFEEFTHKAIAEGNVAKAILIRCGFFDTPENVSRALNGLFNS